MSAPPKFVHLHCHTHFSLLDGATRIDPLILRAKEMGMPAVAITDHGNLFGAMEFYSTAIKHGIKPIIGCEVYMAPKDRRDKEARLMGESNFHLLLLAMNLKGYHNLLKLSSIAYREGFYYKPRVDKEILTEFNEGLICTSTCLGGEVPQALMHKDRRAAEEIVQNYLSIFGPDRFFIELQDHGLREQKMINPELIDIANRQGIGYVASNDVHYLEHDDVEAHDVLCCISTGKLVSDENRFKFEADQFYFKSPEEMNHLFGQTPEALANSVRIAGMCDLQLDFLERHAPVYRPPDEKTPEQYLRELVYEGAEELYTEITDEIRKRIDYELEVIQSKGFSSYFVIVWDFTNYARRNGIPCSARGSGCSSVVAYCLRLTQAEPMRYGLYFERFMDPDRDEMPDIDMDICQNGRSDIIDYVREKYGHVAQIITFGTLKAKAAVKDVSRVMGLGFEEANQLTKLIPNELKMTIDKALEQEPQLAKLYGSDERIRKVIDISKRLEGLARHAGVHAAGVVIADQPLDDFVPLAKSAGDDQVTTQYDGPTVEKVGLLKMDFLGLRTLSALERARQLAEKNHGTRIDWAKIDLTDQKVYSLFARGETKGIFQFESGGMRDVLLKMRPNRIEDLIAANALYRPGPMVNIDAYVSRKHGENWTTPHPHMTEVLTETYGIMVYQEQVSRLVNRLGGIELKRAFRLAKAISKKKTSMIEAERGPFIEGCKNNGVGKDTAEKIFDDILRFGGYAFNKAHSTGYALLAFQTAYMKAYYPVEFMAASLTFEMGNTDKVAEYIDECKRLKIPVRPPDVNASDKDFTVVTSATGANDDDAKGYIRFGLGAIKGVGDRAVEAIITARQEKGSFRHVFEFCDRVDLQLVNRGVLEALIKAGAMDSTGAMRKALMQVLDRAIDHGASLQRDRQDGQMSFFADFSAEKDADSEPPVAIPDAEWTDSEMLAHEKATLGFFVTKHPLSQHEDDIDRFGTAKTVELSNYADGAEVVIGGMISKLRTVVTKTGRNAGSKMGIVLLEDLAGTVEVILFPKTLEANRHLIAQDQVLFFKGQVDRRREEPSVRTNEVIPLEKAAEKLTQTIILRVDETHAERGGLERVLHICRQHSGQCPIYLEVMTTDRMRVTIRCNTIPGVAPSPTFTKAISDLLGEDRIRLVGAVLRKPIPRAAPLPTAPEIPDDTPYAAIEA
jgi:DNA polymerase-3 subunit alpha